MRNRYMQHNKLCIMKVKHIMQNKDAMCRASKCIHRHSTLAHNSHTRAVINCGAYAPML